MQARAGVASFFAAITTLLAGLLAMAFNAAWSQREGGLGGVMPSSDNRAAVTMVRGAHWCHESLAEHALCTDYAHGMEHGSRWLLAPAASPLYLPLCV